MKKIFHAFFLLMMLLPLAGCDLFETDKPQKELDSSKFSVDCELDVKQFEFILSKNIAPQIRCLGENLNLFIRAVESDRPGYMKRVALEAYLKNNRPDVGAEVLSALKSVYDLNYLLRGEDREYISKQNVDELIDFVLVLNSEMSVTIYPLFTSKRDINYSVHEAQRKFVKNSAAKIVNGLRRIFNANPGNDKRDLNIVKLLQSFASDATQDDIDKIIKVLFAKKVLFGGERDVLTHEEVDKRVLQNFVAIATSVFDIVKFRYIKDFNQERIFELLNLNVGTLSRIINDSSLGNRDKEVYFSVQEALDVVDMFVSKDDFDVFKWKTLILEAKRVFMGGNDTVVTGLDFKTLVGHASNVLGTGSSFYSIYKNPKILPALESPLPVTMDFSEFKHTYSESLDALEHFERIVKKYRFFRGKFESAYFTQGIRRNADAIVEVYMYEYAFRMVMKVHGHPNTASLGGYGITQIELGTLVTKLEKTLIDLKLILPRRKDVLVDNISLLSTLFQYQSDKNGVLDANEATEFLLALLTSMDMSKNMQDYYRLKGCEFDKFGRVEPNCFKQHFYKSVCEPFDDGNTTAYRDGYRKFYPLMFEYLGAKNCEELQNSQANMEFLDLSIRAARGCNFYKDNNGNNTTEEIYYSDGDIYSTLMVLLHAEATTLRWDDVHNKGNGNNFMDPAEVDRAYEIYSPALDGFLATMPSIVKSLKKQIYQYLIKYETVPDAKDFGSIWKFVKFLVSFNKKAPAYRRSLAAILNVIGEQNSIAADAAGKPKFDCNWLKDPDNIPPDTAQVPENAVSSTVETRDFTSVLNNVHRTGDIDPQGEPVFVNEKELCLKLPNKTMCL